MGNIFLIKKEPADVRTTRKYQLVFRLPRVVQPNHLGITG